MFGVAPTRVGGVEMFARELARQLAEFGWRSELCFVAEPREPVRRFLDLPDSSIHVLEKVRTPDLDTLRRITSLFRRRRPDLLHLYFTGFLAPYAWLARLSSVRRIYFTDQGSHPEAHQPSAAPLWKRLAGRAISLPYSRAIAISDYNARCLAARGYIAADRVSRIYNAVDLARSSGDGAAFRRKHAIPENRTVVLQVSWIIPEKGIPDLLDAARIVLQTRPETHFVIAGEGERRSEYAALARAMGIEGNLTWTGQVEDPFAEGLYNAADIVCQLSRWEEAFGWVIAEAMACSRPVIATRVGGIPEIVDDGRSGFLVERRQPAETAEKILLLAGDASLRRRMGAAGRQSVETRFNLERTVAELVKLYGIAERS